MIKRLSPNRREKVKLVNVLHTRICECHTYQEEIKMARHNTTQQRYAKTVR